MNTIDKLRDTEQKNALLNSVEVTKVRATDEHGKEGDYSIRCTQGNRLFVQTPKGSIQFPALTGHPDYPVRFQNKADKVPHTVCNAMVTYIKRLKAARALGAQTDLSEPPRDMVEADMLETEKEAYSEEVERSFGLRGMDGNPIRDFDSEHYSESNPIFKLADAGK